jgi:NAD(P)-dependent dehydrogenase (short-subunit alcohol dehydrogenase family)
VTQAGARVVVADIDGEAAEQTAKLANEAQEGVAVALRADATDENDIASLVEAAQRWQGLDIAVNIVGGGGGDKVVLDTPEEDWDRILDLNLRSTVRSSRAFARVMLDRGTKGSIINVASPAGLRAAPGMAAYGAAKAAVINFSWTLAVELAPDGIRVNVVVPAFVTRPGMDWGGSPAEQEALAKRVVPMGRVTKAEDVAGAITCFASDLTSFSTGQVLVCDGGRLLTNPIFS